MQVSSGSMRLSSGVFLCLAALLALIPLGGCTRLQIKLGMRVPLATLPVTSMEASLPKEPAIAPGQKSPLVVHFSTSDGKTWQTEGQGGGKILWSDLTVTPTIVTVNNKGVLSLARDPRLSDGKTGKVVITAPSHPDLRAELEVPLRYNIAYRANFSGANGTSGFDGTAGLDGSSGSDGAIDPNDPAAGPSAGGNGTDGGNGSDGSNGGNGGDAQSVQVWLAPHPGPQALIEAKVQAGKGRPRYYLIDPNGGSLSVTADGGDGGKGGKGGRGGRGGSGGSGSPPGFSGADGHDGMDGHDGSDGNGGQITVTCDPAVRQWLPIAKLSAFRGPKPIINTAPVPPLW